jgi:hypothetical protein
MFESVTTAIKKTVKRYLLMQGKVTEWKMSEEERLAYIKKNPIKPVNKEVADYKWRGQAGAEASKKERDKKRNL